MTTGSYGSGTEKVNTWIDDRALHIQFNNVSRHNALSVDMWQAVPKLLSIAASDDNVRLVVFSGAGEKAFVSGADISQFEDMRATREAVTRYEAMAEEALMAIYNFAKPTLACIRGYCIGGGVNLAISCDIRIAAGNAVFSVPAAKLGLGYRYSAMKNLVDLVGPGIASDLFFTARRIDAHEALSLGLISRVAESGGLGDLLQTYVASIAENAPLTIKAAKLIGREILKPAQTLDAALCARLIRDCFESEDYAEGRKAFMEKRKPVFQGR